MSANLGNRGRFMRLQCQPCGWTPPEGAVMEAVQLHFQVDHDTDKVTLDLVAACSCGAAMAVTNSRPAGPGETKDYLSCGACGNTGHLIRGEKSSPPKDTQS